MVINSDHFIVTCINHQAFPSSFFIERSFNAVSDLTKRLESSEWGNLRLNLTKLPPYLENPIPNGDVWN